jgi:hypothetical protein
MKVKHREKKRPFFYPDTIATKIVEGFNHDTMDITQKQGVYTPAIELSAAIQSRDFTKKYIPYGCSTETLRNDAFLKFKDVNDRMLEANIRFLELYPTPRETNYMGSIIQRGDSQRDKVLRRARFVMGEVLGEWTMEELYLSAKHSQGSTVGVPFVDTSLERKLQSPMTCTERVGPLMNDYLLFDNKLKSALDAEYAELLKTDPLVERYKFVSGSRATTVRKTATKDRMIAVEPTGNMFFQQGLMSMIYNRMRSVSLNVESLPQKHKWLARIGSISGRNATIDWSSASDCVSIELLRYLLPPRWFKIIDRVRSPTIEIDGEVLDTHMISTMGNAVTFPLETLVFWTIGVALHYTLTHEDNRYRIPYRLKTGKYRDMVVSVFGDDCIVPTFMAKQYIATLEELGFIVNDEKSYYKDERFRESCGGDYSAGYNVRPFCLKAPTSTQKSTLEPWLYITMNAMIPRYISYFGALSWLHDRKLFRYFEELFLQYKLELKVVPHDYPDDAGLKVHFDLERFLAYYPGFRRRISKIEVNNNGQTFFRFCRFVYRNEATPKNGGIRLADWLKKPFMPEIPVLELKNPERQNGGYVVAKTKHYAKWVIPTLERVGRYSS